MMSVVMAFHNHHVPRPVTDRRWNNRSAASSRRGSFCISHSCSAAWFLTAQRLLDFYADAGGCTTRIDDEADLLALSDHYEVNFYRRKRTPRDVDH
jgi:hypothetical protein